MKGIFSIFVIVLLSNNFSLAQNDCSCCTEVHKQFDFWEGDWVVFDTTGRQVGENLIVKLEDNCILNENWTGGSGTTGKSYNYYNRVDSMWHQVWVDNSGNVLNLKGHGDGNKMVLRSELTKGQRIAWYYNQITWSKNEDGSVTQLWEILDENEKVVAEAFRGIYKRRAKE